jgi:LCP family protein required for cell wall assembly
MDRDNQRKDLTKGTEETSAGSEKGSGWEQYSNNLGSKINSFTDGDDFLDEVNVSLAQQISMELEGKETNTNTNEKPQNKKKVPKGVKVFAIAFSSIMIMFALLIFTPGGRRLLFNIAGDYIYGKLDYEDVENPDNEIEPGTPTEEKPPKAVEHVVNILLLGVEEIGGASNTDVMIVATMNTKEKTLKLTSIMRDLYVQIPGYNDNKLNSAYAKGGVDLLYQTIENNFDIDLDGYVSVNFNSFEKIVDMLGGVNVTLTSKEAYYLNTTNYISDPSQRRVKEGMNRLSGNQALGYCRVRKVSTGTENNDFGRTQRHRVVLNAIFDEMKHKDILQLGLFMNEVLSNISIKTDITSKEFNTYLEEAASLKANELEQNRIPSDGNYYAEKVTIGKYKQDVLVPKDWEATRNEIHEYIYGNDTNANAGTESDTESGTNTSSLETVQP